MALPEAESKVTRVCPVVLAGGLSSRMGRDKALLKLPNGRTMLEQATALLGDLTAPDGVELLSVVVSGARTGAVPDRFEAAGPLGGLYSVAMYLQESAIDCQALLVVPVDMPLLRTAHLRTLCVAGRCVEQAVFFEDYFLPCWLPMNLRCTEYLEAAARGDSIPSMRALFGYLGCMQLPSPSGDWHMNANRPEEFVEIVNLFER
ncbi:molybdenum cofactor guanylyltransferase [Microbulbifer aggregans]|uniref:molybdenum cofactor guanylyltransferase n=1 Tax=Microbulbifer aggregans TaxID=1769779 RepID=UPI001CFDB37F|nr:NTP transferase domain-containing protein [Microbulbifer aggregans]